MGDNFLKQQVKNSKKGRDKALDSLSQPTLFTTPESISKLFPILEMSGQEVKVKESLLAVHSKSPGRVEIVRGACHVGFVEGDMAKPLLDAMGGIGVTIRVESRNSLSGIAQVQISQSGDAA